MDRADGENASSGILFGVKLPTGIHSKENDAGEAAERGLQPGSGTTDLILGGFHRWLIGDNDAFAQARWQHALQAHARFLPGDRISLDLGYRHGVTRRLAALMQLNVVHRGHDSGENAEAAESGGDALYLAPGVSYEVSRSARVYGLLQLPLWQRVNGVQITADRALTIGVTTKF